MLKLLHFLDNQFTDGGEFVNQTNRMPFIPRRFSNHTLNGTYVLSLCVSVCVTVNYAVGYQAVESVNKHIIIIIIYLHIFQAYRLPPILSYQIIQEKKLLDSVSLFTPSSGLKNMTSEK
jgi:hypothetical protein